MATFGYGRVSTDQQHTENQRIEIEQAGHQVDYWFEDRGVSGKVPAAQRPQFAAMLDKIRDGETLVVAKLDRLGRDAIDIMQVVRGLADRSIKTVVLALSGQDLTAPAGKLMLAMLSAVAEMERDLLVERTQAGLARAKAEGKRLGRPRKTSPQQHQEIRAALAAGATVAATARQYAVSRATIIAIRES
ncbi:recombinase family protein [Aquincola sp. S2]|uniref:Recombinase family protein n=1 Tax=Pseudaquabacterium terrae TaxID=2732868 RepID=A0ABX2EEV1_9BURK|nr:recombinase family protein [Aquabacterium terrae]NRF67139.1 recombinase family protein [Aquabacterium terrae]